MKTLALTVGDPAGIGPEIAVKAFTRWTPPQDIRTIVIGPPELLRICAERIGKKLEIKSVTKAEIATIPPSSRTLFVTDVAGELARGIGVGHPSAESARASLAYIDYAADLALEGSVDAIVTCPVSKEAISRTGVHFTGHTEHLAHRANVSQPVMMFVADNLKVALVTTHIPLKKVPMTVNAEKIVKTVRAVSDALREYFEIPSPRIALCGLNPHAGEGGLLGREELETIIPAAQAAVKQGIQCRGPFPADTLFRRAINGEFDAVVAMYHDQALAAVKTVSPHSVNVTLGLPFVRTSVDHGTAFDIAGKGIADAQSLIEALKLASRMASAKNELFR